MLFALIWIRIKWIAIEWRVVFVVRLANHQYDIQRVTLNGFNICQTIFCGLNHVFQVLISKTYGCKGIQ